MGLKFQNFLKFSKKGTLWGTDFSILLFLLLYLGLLEVKIPWPAEQPHTSFCPSTSPGWKPCDWKKLINNVNWAFMIGQNKTINISDDWVDNMFMSVCDWTNKTILWSWCCDSRDKILSLLSKNCTFLWSSKM